jgi:hypothetical protein
LLPPESFRSSEGAIIASQVENELVETDIREIVAPEAIIDAASVSVGAEPGVFHIRREHDSLTSMEKTLHKKIWHLISDV